MIKAALYLRVSSGKQSKEGDSIPAQREALRKYAKEREYIIAGEYIDDGVSGTKADRDELMLRPDIVSCYSQTYRRFNTVKRRIAPESAVWQLPRASLCAGIPFALTI